MKLIKLLAVFVMFFTVNTLAVTISGNVYCDIDDSGTIESNEVCPSGIIWVKLYNETRQKWISEGPLETDITTGETLFSFTINATGDFRLFIDNNGNTNRDDEPTPPSNMLFKDPSSGSISIVVGNTDLPDNDFTLIPNPVCDCTSGDNNMTIRPIIINGDMSDWTDVLTDPDNGVCDSVTITDYDINKTQTGEIQSTGRNLVRFSWTGEPNGDYVYGYTERLGSNSNTETFLFYKDGDADGLMEAGDIVLTARWQGSTGHVDMEICDYVVDTTDGNASSDFMVWQLDDVGTPLLYPGDTEVPAEWVGKADGYTIHGSLENCRELPDLRGNGSADGLRMEWQVRWEDVGMFPFQPITYHVSTMNSTVNVNNPPGQVDDNMGSCPAKAPSVKLDINKTADTLLPKVGENVTYTVTVTNSGDTTNSVVVDDLLPDGMSYVSYSGGAEWTCTNSGQDVNCSYAGVLMNGESSSLEIVASVDDNTSLWGMPLTNSVCTSSDENVTRVCDEETITVYTPVIALDLNKTASNATPYESARIFYTIAVTNNGPDIANNIVVHDVLPSGVAYNDYNSSGGWSCIEVNNIVDCNLNTGLGVDETTQLFIIVDVNGTAGTVYTNTAYAHADENLTDVSDTADITPVTRPTLATLTVEKGVSEPAPLTGETIIYGILISNVGELDATNVVFTDILPAPAGVTYVGADYNASLGGTFTFTPDNNITWDGFTLPGGTSTTIKITVTVNADENTTVNNEACAHFENNTTDVCYDVDFTVRAPNVTLAIDKEVDHDNPRVGENVTYTIVVTNNGTDTANDVTVIDVLDTDLIYQSSSATVGAYYDNNDTWAIDTLLPDASEELNITVSINADTEGTTISNVAEATADENGTVVRDDANLTVYDPIIILRIQKLVDQTRPVESTNITYTIFVYNDGEDNATNVTVLDTLPDGVTFVSAGGNGWTCDDSVECTNPLVAADTFTSFDINVTVNSGTAGTLLTNEACTWYENNDTEICTELNITVGDDLDLAVTKDVNNSTPSEGETILYTITVTNNGPITATGVQVTESIADLEEEVGVLIVDSTEVSQGLMLPDDHTWDVGTLNAGETATLLVTATVAPGVSGTFENIAFLSDWDQTDIDDSNYLDRASITVTCPCDNISSDGSPAMNKTVGALMIIMTVLIGLFFVRREEKYNRNQR